RGAIHSAAGRSPGDASIAHRCQGPADPGFGGRDQPARNVGRPVPEQRCRKSRGDRENDCQLTRQSEQRGGHIFPPVALPGGISSKSSITSESRLTKAIHIAVFPMRLMRSCSRADQWPLSTKVLIGSSNAWIRNSIACTRPTVSIACSTKPWKAPVS